MLMMTSLVVSAHAADPAPSFHCGLNLNGPPVTIDGNAWDGKDASYYVCNDRAFESQDVDLFPSTDVARAQMIRSSRWGGNRVELTDIPDGRYTVFVYVWEDNNPETYSVSVNGSEVLRSYNSGRGGSWERLGPWYTDAQEGRILITSQGGAANFSGIEIWRGEHDGSVAVALTEEQTTFFENRIRPLLVNHCYECHSEESETAEGGLLVDSSPTLLRGGASGPAIVPGDISSSLLIKAVRYDNDDLQMPPDGKLSDAEIASLEEWIHGDAPDPRRDTTHIPLRTIDVAEARKFWSFQPITDPDVPIVRDAAWPASDIDRFILSQLESSDMSPVELADKRTLIRRATFDLIGLPPTPAEVEAFVDDNSPDAFEKVVERLLASPQYGERWGRHWMDLVRYADTAGENSDFPIPQAYRYRNYIIDAFNDDKPYDEFIREQIAGDLMPATNDEDRNEQIVATGYIAIARRFGSVIENYPQHLTIEDTIDNMGRVFLGLTLSCARCHDHKFDPILQTDYYGLYGILESTRYPFPGIELDKEPRDFVSLYVNGEPGDELAYAVIDGQPGDAPLHLRGEPDHPGDIIPRKFIDLLGGQRLTDEQARHSGRLQLAEWLTDSSNPLTARVMVNRIWQYHFGQGLVNTPSDFGARGQPPTHPELLDWLATRFMESGWSIKQMHRLIMHSRVYQLASTSPSPQETSGPMDVDPTNAMRWRFSRQRLDAESLRDALLMLSGQLDTTRMDEPHPFPPSDQWQFTQHHPFRDSYESNRRSVYLMTARLNSRTFFTTFDGADGNASTAHRDSSVTAVQSLYFLNDEFIHQCATHFALRLLEQSDSENERITLAFQMILGRPPNDDEIVTAREFLMRVRGNLESGETGAQSDRERDCWSSLARGLFRTNEFLYVD